MTVPANSRRRATLGIIVFQSEMCITNEPTEDGEPLTIWNFFQTLAGSSQTQKRSRPSKYCPGLERPANAGPRRMVRKGSETFACAVMVEPPSPSAPRGGAKQLTDRLDAHKRLHDLAVQAHLAIVMLAV